MHKHLDYILYPINIRFFPIQSYSIRVQHYQQNRKVDFESYQCHQGHQHSIPLLLLIPQQFSAGYPEPACENCRVLAKNVYIIDLSACLMTRDTGI